MAVVPTGLGAPPWLRFEETLVTTSRAIRRAFDTRLAGLDLNLSQARLLAYVGEHGPVTQTRLAERLGMGRAATGSMIDVLCQRGLVGRRPDPADRRVWLIALTEDGRATNDRIVTIDAALQAELRHGISRAERRQLTETLLRLQENASTALVRGAPGEAPRSGVRS